jgi:SAM-dependent methyltransferase
MAAAVRPPVRHPRRRDWIVAVRAPSPALLGHVAEMPLVRRPILDAVSRFAASLPAGTRVLDAGAGDAPYAELFGHCDYVTADWPQSVHEGGRQADILASLEALPVDDASFGAVACTEVLEHIADPDMVLAELWRVLEPGGRLCLTTPFAWPLHEEPFDFYRYTPYALSHMLEQAGFADVSIDPNTGFLATLAQMSEMTRWVFTMSGRPRRSNTAPTPRRRVEILLLRACAESIRWLVRRDPWLDRSAEGVSWPTGYHLVARKPAGR